MSSFADRFKHMMERQGPGVKEDEHDSGDRTNELEEGLNSLPTPDVAHVAYDYIDPWQGYQDKGILIGEIIEACSENNDLFSEVFDEVSNLLHGGAGDIISGDRADNSEAKVKEDNPHIPGYGDRDSKVARDVDARADFQSDSRTRRYEEDTTFDELVEIFAESSQKADLTSPSAVNELIQLLMDIKSNVPDTE